MKDYLINVLSKITALFHNDKILKNSLFVLFFIPEVLVIYQLFTSLPHGVGGWLFWSIVATVIMLYHLYVIIKIKNLIIPFYPSVIGYILTYLGLLVVLWMAVLSFNLKSLERKADIEHLENNKNSDVLDTIDENKIAIKKYNDIINNTNDIRVVFRYRNMITGLRATNQVLYLKVEITTNTIENDPFQVLADKTIHNRELILFLFLCLIWLICESGLFVVAPGGQAIKNIDIEESGFYYIKTRFKLFETWLKHLVIEGNLSNLTSDNAMKNYNISYSVSRNFRQALSEIVVIEGEDKIPMLTNDENGQKLNYESDVILKAIKNKM